MAKKILTVAFCIMLVFSFEAFAENTADETIQSETQQEMMPRGDRMGGGGRGPGGQENGNIQPPQMPEGAQPPEIPSRDNQPNDQQMRTSTETSGNSSGIQADKVSGEQSTLPTAENNTEDGRIQNGQNNRIQGVRGGLPGGMGQGDFGVIPQETQSKTAADIVKEYSTPIISVVLLVFAFIFVIFYKRKRY